MKARANRPTAKAPQDSIARSLSPKQESSPARAKASRGASHPTHDEIEFRAYHKYLERGGGHGRDVEDWLQAERELLKKHKRGRPRAVSR
jgi:hypothetical protein